MHSHHGWPSEQKTTAWEEQGEQGDPGWGKWRLGGIYTGKHAQQRAKPSWGRQPWEVRDEHQASAGSFDGSARRGKNQGHREDGGARVGGAVRLDAVRAAERLGGRRSRRAQGSSGLASACETGSKGARHAGELNREEHTQRAGPSWREIRPGAAVRELGELPRGRRPRRGRWSRGGEQRARPGRRARAAAEGERRVLLG
uniref:Uncharacterized protein n=1 Tax=Zea mays TaxID=4577 RepID=A0A804N3I1_MAIZE